MILYHGTNSSSDVFTDEYFGKVTEGSQSRLLGIWSSLTPVFPMSCAQDVLVLKVNSERVLQIPADIFKHLCAEVHNRFDDPHPEDYVHPSVKWRVSYDLVAAIEKNGTIGDFIILNKDKTEILERVSSFDVDRLVELETEHWNDQLMSQRSRFVESLSETAQYKIAI